MHRPWLLAIPFVFAIGCVLQDADPMPDPETFEQGSNVTAQLPDGTQAMTTGNLNLRQGPSTSAAVIDVIPSGTTLTITQGTPQNGFYGVSYNGQDGYCSGKYLVVVSSDAAPPDDAGGGPDDPAHVPWQTIGTGVNFKALQAGTNVFIVYGGYTAKDAWVEGWSDELYRARGKALGIGQLYAVRGPNQSGYANQEIGNSKLAAHLGAGRAAAAEKIVIVAHSSGTFVADELLGQLRTGAGGVPADTLGKTTVFNLDGGGGSDSATLKKLANLYFVYACDAAIGRCSHNAESMKASGQTWASLGGPIKVIADGSGCSASAAGGLWCLHDTVVTTRPHNAAMYDLANDYTDFKGGRKVVTSYLNKL